MDSDQTQGMTAAEALAEILATQKRIEEKLDSIIEFANEAGQTIQGIAEGGLGGMLGSLFGR